MKITTTRIALLLLSLALPSTGLAQATTKLGWDYLTVAPAVVATYTQTIKVDGVTRTEVPVCVASGADTTCTLTIPALASGAHSLSVLAVLNGVGNEAIVSNINPGAGGPKPPVNIRITMTVTFVVP